MHFYTISHNITGLFKNVVDIPVIATLLTLNISVIFTVAVSDLLYGCFVSPFFVENYVRNNWEQSTAYCSFYTFFFTFHDLFAPLCLIVLSIYISLKFTGNTMDEHAQDLPTRQE